MFKLAELFVDITGRDSPLNRTLAGVKAGLFGAAGMAGRAGQGIASGVLGPLSAIGPLAGAAIAGGVALGAGAAAAGLYKAVGAASDLSETLSKTGAVFGSDTATVTDFADKMAKDFGLVKTEVLDAASMFGLIAQGAGVAQGEAAGLSVELAKMAADASSFYNVPVADALEKIRAGLTGESEPLRAFGVMLSEDAVKAKALAMGFTEVNDRVKTLARAQLIKEGLGKASGDLEKTASGFSNTSRKIKGDFQNMMAEVGTAVMPAAQAIQGVIGEVFGGIAGWVSGNKDTLNGWAATAVAAFQGAVDKAREFGAALMDFVGSEAIGSVSEQVRGVLGPVFEWVGGVITGVIDTIAFTFRNFDDILALAALTVQEKLMNMGELFSWLMNTIGELLSWFGRNWPELLNDALSLGYTVATNHLTNLRNLVQATWDFITNPAGGFHFEFTPLLEGFKSTLKELPQIAAPALTSLQDQMNEILDRIGGREAERAKAKVKEALALGKGEAPNPGAKSEAAAGGKAKDKGATTSSLEDFSRKLNEAAGGKDKQGAKLVDLQEKSVEFQQQTVNELKKANSKPTGAVIGAG